jgi:serine/threonine protein kinase
VKAIRDEPSPLLPEKAPFSSEFRHFLACCLHKDAERRWSAKQLLEHPWLRGAEERWAAYRARCAAAGVRTPFDADSSISPDELIRICDALVERKYLDKNERYRKSFFELGMFDRIAQQIGVTMHAVQQCFETRYVQKMQAMGIKI